MCKLNDFHRGKYPLSESLIRVINEGKIDEYVLADKMIRIHLKDYGIYLENVKPLSEIFTIVFYSGIVISGGMLYFLIFYKLIPYFKKQYRLRHPVEGFWVCGTCYAESPILSNTCHQCGRPRSNILIPKK
ncbi:hypothetical protein OMAG_000891 [Candidatus Omnitrophus magneticus]|uniref:RanBP2-type domain-containing protein n=1 Tax=Candidatus Omnitrophus magneticus TaxID=1609969 RepID=A0A0F0CPR2_9BACT|nr:hypothetical protein OMAG_000891 [Candidatus Omnitrophus magneticus]